MTKEKISDKRRKLMIASAAVPVIATLRSGAAIAASSATCQPIPGDVSNLKLASQGNSLYGDTAVRYAVPTKMKSSGSGNKESKLIYNIDGTWYHNSGEIYYGDFKGYEDHEDAYVLMLYRTDDQGTYEVGLWPKVQKPFDYYTPGDPFPINASCLTSIAVTGDNTFRGL